tara:strand:- start:63 stop:1472 length:1410 start_codon:yes stop_codon:yes gene_type:complete
MIEFPFIGGTSSKNSIAFSTHRTVNLYPEKDETYKGQVVLQGFPGYSKWSALNDGAVRGMLPFKNKLVVVSGNTVFSVSPGGSSTQIGSIGTSEGYISMDENGVELMIVDGNSGYIWDGGSFTEITDTTFQATNATHVTHMDSFFVVNQKDSGAIWVSDSFDGTTWSATRTATAEFKSDYVVSLWSDRELMLSGDKTTQIYYNSGASPMPFEALRAGRIIYGIASPFSVAIVNNSSHLLAQDSNGGIFAGRMNGYTIERISTRALEREWASFPDFQSAFGLSIHWKGHEFYILTFDIADTGFGRTFAYDASTSLWFEIGLFKSALGDFQKWDVRSHCFFDGKNIVGDSAGNLHTLSDSVYTFDGETMVSLRRAPVVHESRNRMFIHKLEIDMEVGTSTVMSGQGSDPLIMLDISQDGGRSWRSRNQNLGASGEYLQRVQWHQLGSGYDMVFQVSVSDPVPRKFIAGYVA